MSTRTGRSYSSKAQTISVSQDGAAQDTMKNVDSIAITEQKGLLTAKLTADNHQGNNYS